MLMRRMKESVKTPTTFATQSASSSSPPTMGSLPKQCTENGGEYLHSSRLGLPPDLFLTRFNERAWALINHFADYSDHDPIFDFASTIAILPFRCVNLAMHSFADELRALFGSQCSTALSLCEGRYWSYMYTQLEHIDGTPVLFAAMWR